MDVAHKKVVCSVHHAVDAENNAPNTNNHIQVRTGHLDNSKICEKNYVQIKDFI